MKIVSRAYKLPSNIAEDIERRLREADFSPKLSDRELADEIADIFDIVKSCHCVDIHPDALNITEALLEQYERAIKKYS